MQISGTLPNLPKAEPKPPKRPLTCLQEFLSAGLEFRIKVVEFDTDLQEAPRPSKGPARTPKTAPNMPPRAPQCRTKVPYQSRRVLIRISRKLPNPPKGPSAILNASTNTNTSTLHLALPIPTDPRAILGTQSALESSLEIPPKATQYHNPLF